MRLKSAVIAMGLLAAGCGGSSSVARKLPERLGELRGRAIAERIAQASPRPASVLVIQLADPVNPKVADSEWEGFIAGWGGESGLQRVTIASEDPEYAVASDLGLSLQHLKQKAGGAKPAAICSFARLQDSVAGAPASDLPPLYYAVAVPSESPWVKMAGRGSVKGLLMAREDANLVGMTVEQAAFDSVYRIAP